LYFAIFCDIKAMKTIIFSRAAYRDFEALSADIQAQIDATLDAYAMFGRGDVKHLGGRNAHRLRSGRYRILFAEDEVTILAIYIGKRETTTYLRH